jgi:hypothetical protein
MGYHKLIKPSHLLQCQLFNKNLYTPWYIKHVKSLVYEGDPTYKHVFSIICLLLISSSPQHHKLCLFSGPAMLVCEVYHLLTYGPPEITLYLGVLF